MQLPRNYVRLSMMMFMQFGIYGLWLPIAARFLTAETSDGGLGFSEGQSGIIVGIAASVGAICSPLIVQFADRTFAAQRFLGILMLVGGFLKICVYPQDTFAAWLLLSVAFTLMFMPAAAICNALAMRHLDEPDRQFPGVRLWTAVAWILVGWTFSLLMLKQNVQPSWLPPFFQGDDVSPLAAAMRKSVLWSGILAMLYGVWAFFCLPNSPPVKTQSKRLAVADALALLRIRSFSIILLVAVFIAPLNTIYFIQCFKFLKAAGLDEAYIMPAMALGQFCEVGMYLVLGKLLPRIGFKKVIVIGLAAYAFRFAIFGTINLPIWVMVIAQLIHGPCYAFFTSTCFIYANRVAPKDVRNSAQSIFNFVWYGVGPLLAAALNGFLANRFARDDTLKLAEFSGYWYSAAGIAIAAVVLFGLLFREDPATSDEENESNEGESNEPA